MQLQLAARRIAAQRWSHSFPFLSFFFDFLTFALCLLAECKGEEILFQILKNICKLFDPPQHIIYGLLCRLFIRLAIHFFFSILIIGDLFLLPSVTLFLLFKKVLWSHCQKQASTCFQSTSRCQNLHNSRSTRGIEVVWRQLCSVFLGNWRVLSYFFASFASFLGGHVNMLEWFETG